MPLTRREFLKGLSVTLGGLGLAQTGYQHLVPYVKQPDNIIPGISTWFATSCRECPAGCAMLVENRDAHVIKCEGNPLHPISGDALCARGQASLQGLYDPYRVRNPLFRDSTGEFRDISWTRVLTQITEHVRPGKRIAIISDLQTGSLTNLMRSWLGALGSSRLLIYEPISYEAVKSVYGGVVPTFDIAESDYILSLAADFLETWVSPVEYARQFAKMRTIRNGTRGGFAYIGPRLSMTASNADVRLLVPPGGISEVVFALNGTGSIEDVAIKYKLDVNDLRSVADGLRRSANQLVLPGLDSDSARAARELNASLGTGAVNTGRPHATTTIAGSAEIENFISAMEAGEIDTLIVIGANPVFSLSNSNRFVEALGEVDALISLSSYMDETTALADWVLPSNTPLESWGDYVPYPDVANLMQPTMGTVFDTRQTGDILMALAKRAGIGVRSVFGAPNFYSYLRNQWGLPEGTEAREDAWHNLLQQGGQWPGAQVTAGHMPSVTFSPAAVTLATEAKPATLVNGELILFAHPHIYLYDGRGANKPWLQEMSEPMTKAAWTSWAELHPDTAVDMGVETDDTITIDTGEAELSVPVYVWEGVTPGTVVIPMGQGHKAYGEYAEGVGINIFPLLNNDNPTASVNKGSSADVVTRWTGDYEEHDREIVQTATFDEVHRGHSHITLPMPQGYDWNDFYPGHEHDSYRWAMVVDTNKCIGCHACSVACYAENNIGFVGKEGIRRNREMAWLRIDRYIDWERKTSPVIFQPMLCQHCDAAPCETVCPVYAAVHSPDGLNEQVYNRCVGTRYCSNNCPYKVRRFNWWDYEWPEPLNWQLNPDVTVRCRGVMEKCTFCVQRIRQARKLALKEGRRIVDGEVTPACVQTCPTGVYTFGDLKDPDSQVAKIIRENPRAYQVLHELNTKPAVIYLKRIIS